VKPKLHLPKPITYLIGFATIIDVAGRIIFLFQSRFPFSSVKEPKLGWVVFGCFVVAGFFRSAGYFQDKTAKNIMSYLGAMALFQTASYVALYVQNSIPSLLLSVLSLACEFLVLFGCYVHLRELAGKVSTPSGHLPSPARDSRYWLLGFALGFIVGYIPLLNTQPLSDRINPFDAWAQGFWWVGLFLSATVITLMQPQRLWRWGFAVGLGLPMAVAVRIIIDLSRDLSSHTLFPLTIFFSLLVGVLSAFVGAFFGIAIKGIFKNLL
jgi:hypothetical protein